MGHLTRALSLARAATRHSLRRSITIVTNSPYARRACLQDELPASCNLAAIDHRLNRNEVVGAIARILADSSFDALLVDTFPRGLAGELDAILPKLNCRKVLIHRDINPRYLNTIPISGLLDQYDLLLIPGEDAPFQSHWLARRTAPWFVRDANELFAVDEARVQLGIGNTVLKTIVVVGCGKLCELPAFRRLARQLQKVLQGKANVRFVCMDDTHHDPQGHLSTWPLIRCMPAIDLVLGAGGYNTVNECRATHTPLLAVGQPRLYDQQANRLRASERAESIDELREKSIAMMNSSFATMRPPVTPQFENGAHFAVREIESL
jgi:hypothetical protein